MGKIHFGVILGWSVVHSVRGYSPWFCCVCVIHNLLNFPGRPLPFLPHRTCQAVLWFIVNQLAGAEAAEAKGLDLYSVCCLVGYCMVPLVVYSAGSLLLPR